MILKVNHRSLLILLLMGLFLAARVDAQVPTSPSTDPPVEKPPATPEPAPAAPVVQGTAYREPNYPQPSVSKAELYAQLAANITMLILASRQKPPQQRQRGENIKSSGCGGSSFRGRCEIFQFTNYDFPSTGNTCGQAAMATAMWTAGLTHNNNPKSLAKSIYDFAPPKITLGNMIELKGTLGTDWRQINYGLDGFKGQGIKYTWINGEAEIKKYLGMNWPVMIMLDTGTLSQYNYQWWTGHWVTAFGYDANYIYVSNFPNNRMTWAQLNDAFRKGTLAVGHGTSGRAAVVWK